MTQGETHHRSKLLGHNVPSQMKDDIFFLAGMRQFDSLVTFFHMLAEGKNRLQGITGQPFTDGREVGRHEGMQLQAKNLLDISTEYAKSHNEE